MITTNRGGRLTYMSQAAQALTGWLQQDAMGAELTTMFSFEEDGPAQVMENPAMQAMMECRIVRFRPAFLSACTSAADFPCSNAADCLTVKTRNS